MQYFVPWGAQPLAGPPPPPPPRAHKRQLSSASQSSISAVGTFDVSPAAPELYSEQYSASARDGQAEASCSHQTCSSCRELRQVVSGLEQKIGADIARLQKDSQREQEQLSNDMSQRWQGLESTSWKHVGELKDQNRQLRQKNYELEVQNGHLNRHVMLLQEQMAAFKDQQAQFQSVLRASQDRAALLSATLADSKMIKVPHTGADIW